MASINPSAIIKHTSNFLNQILTQPDNLHRLLSSSKLKLPSPINPTLLQASTLFTQSSLSNSSSIEKLLLSLSTPSPLSSLLLSLTYSNLNRHVSAALALLDIFILDPAFARSEDLALPVFESLFIPYLVPAVQWFSQQRGKVLAGSRKFEAMSVLSRMSGGQAKELRELERGYEDVMDENCRVYAEYLKKVLEGSDGLSPPELVFMRSDGVLEEEEEEEEERGSVIGLEKGQYNNPMWVGEDQYVEFSTQQSRKNQNNKKNPSPSYPKRVPSHFLNKHQSNERRNMKGNLISDSGQSSTEFIENYEESSSEYELDIENNNPEPTMSQNNQSQGQDEKQEQQTPLEFTCSPITSMVDSDSFISSSKANPPKDFVCPITSSIFNDPVTLETGQTYERKAIQEWLDRGNSTCPVTRQKLSSTQLPKTNYVLKRLIDSWIEQNPYSTPIQNQSQSPSPLRAPSPTSVISQASIDGTTADLRLAISQLCTSEILNESEMAVLHIEQFWRDSNMESEILAALSKPAVINGFVEILFNSVNPQILRSTIFLLAELASKDKYVVQTLTRVDSDIDCMVALFKKGLVEAIVLIYLLNLSLENLIGMDMHDALIMTVKRNEEEEFDICLKPKTVSVLLLWRIMRDDARTSAVVAGSLVSGRAIQSVVLSLGAELIEERIAAIGILVRCIEEDGNCRNSIADQAKLAEVLESFTVANDIERLEIVRFLHELVKLSRRTFNQQILQIMKDEGVFSTMHTLLIYLQTALKDQAPIVAALLLQLDLLVEPKLMSVYREEAIDALISSLKDSNFPSTQILAAETISSLQGRFSYSGKPLVRAFLLKHAGMTKSYRALMRAEQLGHVLEDPDENLEEEKAADEWERRMAFALVSHEFGLIFEALADGMKSKNAELFSVCLVSATWLVHMLSFLPDTGLRGAARMCLLKRYISILKSSRNVDDKAFAMLALRSFMNDPEGMNVLTLHIKYIMKTMRELKKSSVIAYEMLKLLSDGKESSTHDFWNHKELNQADCSTNGEVSSIVYFRKMIFSGHSDGTIKIWSGSENILDQIQEAREHTKAVTSLAILQSGDKLYSGSLDKTVRIRNDISTCVNNSKNKVLIPNILGWLHKSFFDSVLWAISSINYHHTLHRLGLIGGRWTEVWCIRDGKICCVEVHDMKDQVHNLTVANTIACFSPQGAGVKVFSWNGGSKLINPNKYVKALALVNGKLYCGCHDNSIQEIDLASGTLRSIQTGNKKLLAKANPIYALQVNDGLLYSASSTSDGSTVKIHNASNYTLIGSLPCTAEIRSIAISTDLIYIGSKMGIVDIWSKEKLTRIASLQTKTNSKVQCMAVDSEGEVLVVGTSDGRIQAWGLA